MAKQKSTPPSERTPSSPLFNLGDRVRILHSGNQWGRIVELWGPLAPGGVQAYRVRIHGRSRPTYVDLGENQLEPLPKKKEPGLETSKEGRWGAKQQPAPAPEGATSGPRFNLGDRVRIRHSSNLRGRIVELGGPFGPGGAQIYRVRVRGMVKPTYIDLREDQLELLPRKG